MHAKVSPVIEHACCICIRFSALRDGWEAASDAFVRKLASNKGEGAVVLEAVARVAFDSES